MFGNSSDRICGPCRNGFVQRGAACIDVQLNDITNETITLENVATYVNLTALAVMQRNQNQDGIVSLLTITKSISQVS
jgi:hypothetical protein